MPTGEHHETHQDRTSLHRPERTRRRTAVDRRCIRADDNIHNGSDRNDGDGRDDDFRDDNRYIGNHDDNGIDYADDNLDHRDADDDIHDDRNHEHNDRDDNAGCHDKHRSQEGRNSLQAGYGGAVRRDREGARRDRGAA